MASSLTNRAVPVKQDLENIWSGDTYNETFNVRNKNLGKTNFDFTNQSGKMQVRDRLKSNKAILTFTSSDGTVTLADGQIDLFQSGSTMDIDSGYYDYDFQLTNTLTGAVRTLFYGKFGIIDENTV